MPIGGCLYTLFTFHGLEEEEEGFYKFLPANTADRLWQSLSNPAKRHSFVSN